MLGSYCVNYKHVVQAMMYSAGYEYFIALQIDCLVASKHYLLAGLVCTHRVVRIITILFRGLTRRV